jgi:hypothetical protein
MSNFRESDSLVNQNIFRIAIEGNQTKPKVNEATQNLQNSEYLSSEHTLLVGKKVQFVNPSHNSNNKEYQTKHSSLSTDDLFNCLKGNNLFK